MFCNPKGYGLGFAPFHPLILNNNPQTKQALNEGHHSSTGFMARPFVGSSISINNNNNKKINLKYTANNYKGTIIRFTSQGRVLITALTSQQQSQSPPSPMAIWEAGDNFTPQHK
ncbi:hypothetical protein SLEP1_g17214 [Rubroshorea leprosula]|uniref:Uncharacterized protein n=1 Tax=Rubroshorea leprosula TaxID=152421 RepID=A0AAV5IZD1_9ROSI|nr:hypothetical protein SLEP1_g17214 [Rubroshorea leprosula]